MSPGTPSGPEPQAAPPTSAPDGERDAQSLIADRCHSALLSAWSDVESEFNDLVLVRLQHGLQLHREMVEKIGLNEAAPELWTPRAEGLLEYRRLLSAEFIDPLSAAFGDGGRSASAITRVNAALAETFASLRELPETATAPWPEGALAPHESDDLRRRIGKSVGRLFSRARKAGGNREIQLRTAAAQHLSEVVAPAEDRAAREWAAASAQWTHELEAAWVAWSDTALPALVRSEVADAEDFVADWEAIRTAALDFQTQLETLAAASPVSGARDQAQVRAAAARERLDVEVALAGSFLERGNGERVSPPELEKSLRMIPAYTAWDEAFVARLRMYRSLLSIFAGTTAVQRRLISRFSEQNLTPVRALPDVGKALEALSAGLDGASEERLATLRVGVEEILEPAIASLPPSSEVQRLLSAGSDSTIEALTAMVRQTPTSLDIHADHARPPTGPRGVDIRPVPLQELARQSFDALRIERIRASTSGLVAAVEEVREGVTALAEVFAFADKAAVQELEEGAEGAGERAASLVSEALHSMSESLRNEVRELEVALASAQKRLSSEICEGSLALLDRVAAGRMQAQLLAARSRLTDLRIRLNERWGPPVDRAAAWLVQRAKIVRRFVSRSLRKGSAIVGGSTSVYAASTREIKALADPDALTDELPLVYKRLFTLDALTEPALLAGRSPEMADMMSRWRSWQTEDGIPVVVRGRQGSGVTSFLNVLSSAIEDDEGTVVRVTLSERVEDEAELAALLAKAIGVASCDTLAGLATAIFAADASSIPGMLAVDDMEHLFLRVPGGTDLIERMLTLMAETEPRIFWVGGITTSAWQLVMTSEPTAVSQIDVLDLSPLSGEDIRSAITLRHRRSGLPIRYEEPETGRRMLKRRLSRMRDEDGYQEVLANDFFEKLEKSSTGHLRLALFQWLRATDFGTGEGLLVSYPEKPNFSLLESLGLTQNFTLKAFLEHRTLSLEEHDRIFRLPRHESYQIFESLGNRYLIGVVPRERRQEGSGERSEVVEDLRYQIQPLLIGAVIAHLQSRNIVH